MRKTILLTAISLFCLAAHAEGDATSPGICIDTDQIAGFRVVDKTTVAFVLKDGTILLNQLDGELPALIYDGGVTRAPYYGDDVRKLCENRSHLYWGKLQYQMGAFKLDPDSRFKTAQALFSSGNTHMERNELDEAIKDFDAAITLAPKLGEIRAVRALAYSSKGDQPRAKQDIADAMALDPKNPAILGVKSYLDKK